MLKSTQITEPETIMRLQKYMSQAGFCSRREAEKYITAGMVKVNGAVTKVLGTKVDAVADRVEVNGRLLAIVARSVYIALNKPQGYVTSCNQDGDKIVLDLVDIADRIVPVGRLDKDSTGLLILTNDGNFHHNLLHPSFDHEKEYLVTLSKPLPDKCLKSMAEGLPMMGTRTRPAKIKKLSPRRFRIIIQEGKNRQIRRMVRKVGGNVTALKRIRISNIKLGKLPPGQWRYLTDAEKNIF